MSLISCNSHTKNILPLERKVKQQRATTYNITAKKKERRL